MFKGFGHSIGLISYPKKNIASHDFIPIESLSLKQLKIFRNQIKRQGLDKLEFYKNLLK